MSRDVSAKERDLLLLLVSSLPPKIAKILKAQIDSLTISGGEHTMLALSVDPTSPKIEQGSGPLSLKAVVHGDNGEPTGELLLWTTDGYLSQLEYAWYTEQIPSKLPAVSQVAVTMS